MRNPNGIHAESSRTPKASRAGALYSTPLHSTPAPGTGVSPHPSLRTVGAEPATSDASPQPSIETMDDRFADEPLFPDYEPTTDLEKLSAGRRLTLRQHADIQRGVHPLTKEPLPEPSPGTCGDCAFRVSVHGDAKVYPKCFRTGVRRSNSVTTDVRAFWPACPGYVAIADLNEEQQLRLDCGESPSVVIGR